MNSLEVIVTADCARDSLDGFLLSNALNGGEVIFLLVVGERAPNQLMLDQQIWLGREISVDYVPLLPYRRVIATITTASSRIGRLRGVVSSIRCSSHISRLSRIFNSNR